MMNKKKKTTEQFIKEAKKIHGDLYEYSNVEYKNNREKVKIVCPIHGEFWKTPNKHLDRKQGCPKCSLTSRRMDKEDFVQKAKQIHGDKYDYSEVEYINNSTKVQIICPIHGSFWQSPNSHLNGSSCPTCRIDSLFSSTEEFVQKAKEIHGDIYDYSEVEYVNNREKVKVICPKHGEFYQTPSNHLLGNGCLTCRIDNLSSSTEEFTREAKEVHGDIYDYSEVEYVNNRTKVKIKCSIHGAFYQTPSNHLKGCGCPSCVHHISKGEKEIYEFLKTLLY